MGEQSVLLRAVEAVNFVDEENGSLSVETEAFLGAGYCFSDILHPRKHGGYRHKRCAARLRQHLCEGSLPGPRRSPENERGNLALLDGPPKEMPFTGQMLLADQLSNSFGPHAFGERRSRLGFLLSGMSKKVHCLSP